MSLPSPIELDRVVKDPKLVELILIVTDSLTRDADYGGLTIGLPDKPRALFYVGPLPQGVDKVIRFIAKTQGYNVSAVRNPDQLKQYETATAADPKDY